VLPSTPSPTSSCVSNASSRIKNPLFVPVRAPTRRKSREHMGFGRKLMKTEPSQPRPRAPPMARWGASLPAPTPATSPTGGNSPAPGRPRPTAVFFARAPLGREILRTPASGGSRQNRPVPKKTGRPLNTQLRAAPFFFSPLLPLSRPASSDGLENVFPGPLRLQDQPPEAAFVKLPVFSGGSVPDGFHPPPGVPTVGQWVEGADPRPFRFLFSPLVC